MIRQTQAEIKRETLRKLKLKQELQHARLKGVSMRSNVDFKAQIAKCQHYGEEMRALLGELSNC
jgi:hypothetical protein